MNDCFGSEFLEPPEDPGIRFGGGRREGVRYADPDWWLVD